MSKHITSITVQLVTIESNRPIAEVIAHLDKEINKGGSPDALRYFQGGKSRDEIVDKVTETLGDGDFIHFLSLPHGKWVNSYFGIDAAPTAFMYTYGNPLIAAGIMKHDIRAGLNIPPRLFVVENEDRSGTKVIYHLPSSVMALDDENVDLKVATGELDAKVEKLVLKILTG